MKSILLIIAIALSLQAELSVKKIAQINNFVNRNIVYKSDILNYKKNDYWATPSEILQKRSGDCEDYAILKYALLLKSGFKKEDIRFIFTVFNGIGHVYLEVKFNNEVYSLDNVNRDIFVNKHKKMLNILASSSANSKLKRKLNAAIENPAV